MKTKTLYRVIQSHPVGYRPLVFEHHEVFATTWHWLAKLYAKCLGGIVEPHRTMLPQYDRDESGRWIQLN